MSDQRANAGLEDAARLLDLVPFIISHQGISLLELAKQFAITPDEMTSDLTTLWMCGLPGYTAYELIDLSFDSGFVTISNAHTLERPRNLQRNEALALLLGLETLLEEIDATSSELKESIAQLIVRISKILDEGAAQRVKAGTPGSSVLRAQFVEAMEARALLRITYHSSAQDEVSERVIEPLSFTTLNGMEYLEAYCHRASGYRTFRLDRIISAQLEESSKGMAKNAPLVPESPSSLFSLYIFSRRRDAFERFSILDSIPHSADLLEAESFSPEWTIREVMSLGGACAIYSPKTLRTAVRNRALHALEGYSQKKG